MKWSKLIANLAGNATSAIVGLTPAVIYEDSGCYAIERRQLREAFAVIRRSLGLRAVALPGGDVRLLHLATRLPADARPAAPRPRVSAARAAASRRRCCCTRASPARSARRSRGSTARSRGRDGPGRRGGGQRGACPSSSPRSLLDRAAAGLVRRPDRPARGEVGVAG